MDDGGRALLRALPGPHLSGRGVTSLELVTHLQRVAERHPQPVVVHATDSFFAPHLHTVGCVGVRGPDAIRQVLTNAADYAPLVPDLEDLPPDVRALSHGVFTLDGEEHGRHRLALRDVVRLDEAMIDAVTGAARTVVRSWLERPVDLGPACRLAARDVVGAALFGSGGPGSEIGAAVQRVVDGRRARRLATSAVGRRTARLATIVASRHLAVVIDRWLRDPDRRGSLAPLGMVVDDASLVPMAVAEVTALTAAATEPTAASLAWAVLALSQHPGLQSQIAEAPGGGGAAAGERHRHDVLDRLVYESQRLLPSSAIVTRLTLRPVEVAGHVLPGRCEVIVSSLLAHREPGRYPEPARFSPLRWRALEPSPFEFFPFGAGVRRCMGSSIARLVLRSVLAELVAVGRVEMVFDTHVGWRMPDALVPTVGVPIVVERRGRTAPGRLFGPLRTLVDFASFDLDEF